MRLLDALRPTAMPCGASEVPGAESRAALAAARGRLGAVGSDVRHHGARGSRSPSPSPHSRAEASTGKRHPPARRPARRGLRETGPNSRCGKDAAGKGGSMRGAGARRRGRKAPHAPRSTETLVGVPVPTGSLALQGQGHGGMVTPSACPSQAQAGQEVPVPGGRDGTGSSAGAAGVPRLLGPWGPRPPEHTQSPTPRGSPVPHASIRDVGGRGNARGSLCPRRGRHWGWQTGLRASAAWHRAISQHVPAWDMVVSPLLPQKSSFFGS